MKLFFQIFLSCFFSYSVKGQECIYFNDTCQIKCIYNFTFHSDTSNFKTIIKDLMVLEIGKKSSLFYSYYRRIGDSLFENDCQKGLLDNSKDDGAKYYISAIASYIGQNFPTGQITVTDKATLLYNYKYVETLKPQDWKIFDETATISNLKCQKASTFFRGRKYEAWFSIDVPIIYGPYKFSGLPGLIVRITDTKNNFLYELLKIEYGSSDVPMKICQVFTTFSDNKFIETTRKEFNELKKLSFEDPIGFLEVNSGIYEMKIDMTPQERRAKSRPYNPIELE